MRIFLVGYMGSGKSTMGRELARTLDLNFVDLDEQIVNRAGKDIPAIFATEGEKYFRDLEKQTLDEWLEQDSYVMACGGGTPCFHDNMDRMNAAGLTVYLKLSSDSLFERLQKNQDSRPLIAGKSKEELRQFIAEGLEEREDWYHLAHYRVKAKQLDAAQLADFLKVLDH